MDILFLGAAGTVTGSRYLVNAGTRRILIDCGLFQGYKHLRERNWADLPVDPRSIDVVLLTHAHVDHCGWLPRLRKQGFRGRIRSTASTRDLCAIMLPDAGRLQEEDARYANKRGFSKHRPALPLFTEEDAVACQEAFEPAGYGEPLDLGGGARATFRQAGHILGAAMISLQDASGTLHFTGDLGRAGDPLMHDPDVVAEADWLVCESTYGSRTHSHEDAQVLLRDVVTRTIGRGGTVLIPAFAVGRAQLVLLHLHRLRAGGLIPNVPIYVNSPMAVDVSALYARHDGGHRLSDADCRAAFGAAVYVSSVEESKALNADASPKIVISASGMAAGGRVLHHLKVLAPDARNAVVFSGYQAGGTRGRAMVDGAASVRIHGQDVPIRCEVLKMDCLSAHADRDEIVRWMRGFTTPPRQVFLTHGEPSAAEALRVHVADQLGWRPRVAQHLERVELAR
jgi:metallo-beta-lactamase family protein